MADSLMHRRGTIRIANANSSIFQMNLPLAVDARTALAVYRFQERHSLKEVFIMAADWQENPEPGEEDWFVELTSDELEDDEFLEEFAHARFELWPRSETPFEVVVQFQPHGIS